MKVKELNRDIFYTHYNRFKFLIKFKKELTLVLPASEAKAVPPLSQTLTQVGLNTNEFCEKFNTMTKIFPVGSLVPISVFYIPKEKNFEICFRPFQLKLILQQYINLIDFKYQISILDLFRAVLIKSHVLNESNIKKVLRSILGTLRSYEFPVQIIFSLEDYESAVDLDIINDSNINKISSIILLDNVKETNEEFDEGSSDKVESINNFNEGILLEEEKNSEIKFFTKYDNIYVYDILEDKNKKQ